MASLLRRNRRASPATVMSSSRSPGQIIVAAASEVDLADEKARNRARKRRADWQARAWEFIDDLGEAGYASRYFGNGMSRLTLFVGVRPEPNDDPVPLELEPEPGAGYAAEEAQIATDALARLDSPEGGKAEMLRRLAIDLFVPGEAYLCGREDEDQGERWDVYSTEELRPAQSHEDRWELAMSPDGGGTDATLLPDNTVATRIWRPHPRITAWPDSPMRSALGICDELLTLRKSIKGSALSRLTSAGWLPLPASMRQGHAGDDVEEAEGPIQDKVVQDFIDVAAAGIADPASAAARVPMISWVPDAVYEMLDQGKFFSWAQDIDATAAAQREELIRSFANTIDLPPEIITGKAGLNEWGAWVVTEDVWKAHLEPAAILIVTALTAAYLTPYLREAGVEDPRRFVVWYDPGQVLSRPQRSEETRWAYENYLISMDRARDDLAYSEEDAPDESELELRLIIDQIKRAPTSANVAQLPGHQQGEEGETGIPAPAQPRALPGTQTQPNNAPEAPAPVAGSAQLAPIPGLAETLGRMDAGLLLDLHAQVNAHVRGVLEHVNSRLLSLANKEAPLRATLKGLTGRSLQVAPTLGPGVVARLAAGQDLLGELAAFRLTWEERTGRTIDEVLRLAQEQGRMTEAQATAWSARMDAERAAGWETLLAGMTAATERLLFRPEPIVGAAAPQEEQGEQDGQFVPPAVSRAALIAAGGAGLIAAGMLSGDRVEELWRDAGVIFDRWVWVYGDPAARRHGPFRPHYNRDSIRNGGQTYSGPNDPLLQEASWPFRLWPKDHHGCLCMVHRAEAYLRGDPSIVVLPGDLPGEEAA